MSNVSRSLRGILIGIAMLVFGLPAWAQSCALCYTQAASSGTRMINALQSGILILVIPPTLGSLVVIAILYRKRNHFHQTHAGVGTP